MVRRLVDSATAAEYLGITARHLRDLTYRRELAFVKVGGSLRFDLRDLERFIESHKTEAVS